MSNELVTMSDMQVMANAVAKSGLFGVKTPEQAITLMLISQAEGRHPALAARDYDIIQNKPAKKAEAMMRDFIASGGKVEWHLLDDKVADATFSHPQGGTVRIDWTMQRAIAAGLGGKDMWKKYPRQMLRSRTISEGIRTVCPMATSGMYVPEEVQDFASVKNITPTSGADERMTIEQQEKVKKVVDDVHACLFDGGVADAVVELENAALDADEYTYFWTFFDSKQRKAIKDEQERVRAQQRIKDATPISEGQRKRLEARISELGMNRDTIKAYCQATFGKEHFADLSKDEYLALDSHMDNMRDAVEGKPVVVEQVAEISPDQVIELSDVLQGHADVRAEILRTFGALAKIPASKYAKVLAKARIMCGEVV